MNVRLRSVLVFMMFSAACLASSFPDGSPEQALVEILTATKAEEVARHLPTALGKEFETLDAEGKHQCEQALLIGNSLRQEGSTLRAAEDGESLVVLESSDSQSSVRVQREIMGGDQAMLELAMEREGSILRSVMVWMDLEDGEWRVTEVQFPGVGNRLLLDSGFVDRFRDRGRRDRESSVMGTLYTLHWAVQAYANTNPEIGFPLDLLLLASSGNSGENSDDDGDTDSGFLDPAVAQNDFSKDGYVFHYELRQAGADGDYWITARPVEYGKTGRGSFLIDNSGIVRSTTEDREPNPQDDPHNEQQAYIR